MSYCHDRDWPDAGEGMCCAGAAMFGPGRCTCWEPVYDLDQAPARTDGEPVVRPTPCGDCAFRPDSPERRGEGEVMHDADDLEAVLAGERPFWCHDGIRRPVRWEHRPEDTPPTGVSVPGSPVNYCPPIVDDVPYRADGSPAFICAGWAARRQARRP